MFAQALVTSVYLVLVTTFLHGEIIETQQMAELYSHLTPNTLVIFDIDNTLIEPVQTLGSDQGFYYRINQYQREGFDPFLSKEKAIAAWTAIQSVTKVKLVEKGSETIVKHLQSLGYPVMGLTTRGLGLSTRTVEQLKTVDIDLSATAPTQNEIFFMNQRGVLFRGGVLFTAGTHKGTALLKLLQAIQCFPKPILFINDKASHLEPVEEMCQQQDILFIGLRYGLLDEKVRNFPEEIVNTQFAHFGKILSDEEAKAMLTHQR